MKRFWREFARNVPWLTKSRHVAQVAPTAPPGTWKPATADFAELFPALDDLLRAASITPIDVSNAPHLLFTWPSREGGTCSWLSPAPPSAPPTSIHNDHRILMASFGGVTERSNEPTWWLENQNDALTEREAHRDGTLVESVAWLFDEEGLQMPIRPGDFYSIAEEANGNTTLCHRKTGEIVLFAPDHSFDHVEPLPGCPEYTLYRLPEAPDFRAWVDMLACQWRDRAITA